MDILRQISARLESSEITQRRGVHLDDVSDEEELVAPNPKLEEEKDDERIFRALFREKFRPYFKLPSYCGKLDSDCLLDWISEIKKYFDYESILKDMKVRISATKLNGNTSLSWDHLKIDRQRRGKEKIKTWVKMVGKLKNKFLHVDYQVNLLRRMQDLRQKDMTAKDYTEEFYKLGIISRHVDDEVYNTHPFFIILDFSFKPYHALL